MVDKQHIKGAAQQAKGSVKAATGALTGNKSLEAEGHADRAAGGVRKAVGTVKDKLRGK